jgi:hypothetical protein
MSNPKSFKSRSVLCFFVAVGLLSLSESYAAQVQVGGQMPQPSVDHEDSNESTKYDDAYVAHVPSEKVQADAQKVQAQKDHEAYLRRIDRVTRPGR